MPGFNKYLIIRKQCWSIRYLYHRLKYKVDDGVIPALTNRVGPISYKSNNVEKFNICGDTCVFYFLLINTYLFNVNFEWKQQDVGCNSTNYKEL